VAARLVERDVEPVEAVILRRGSSRRFSHAPIARTTFDTLLAATTAPISTDALVATDLYPIVNAVEDLAPGAYVFDRATLRLVLLRAGNFRDEATYLDLGQPLAGDAAFNAYWLVSLEGLDARGYRAAQFAAAIEAGQLYLAAYRQGLGATGLTFFDDDVTRFYEPHAAGKSVMFLTAVGRPATRPKA
jgi:nitroreductase